MTITWKIKDCKYAYNLDGKNKVVDEVKWEILATDTLGRQSSIEGWIKLGPPSSDFIEWNDLTEEIILQWVFSSFPVDENNNNKKDDYEQNAIDMLEEKQNETHGVGLPW